MKIYENQQNQFEFLAAYRTLAVLPCEFLTAYRPYRKDFPYRKDLILTAPRRKDLFLPSYRWGNYNYFCI